MKNKKISKILIGTNNRGKLREITSLLPENVKVFSTKDFNLKSPKETGKTFESNALIKAKYFSKKTNLICLSDDSGLEIDILKKKPGIYSARWGGKNSDFNKAMSRVYKELDQKDKEWNDCEKPDDWDDTKLTTGDWFNLVYRQNQLMHLIYTNDELIQMIDYINFCKNLSNVKLFAFQSA